MIETDMIVAAEKLAYAISMLVYLPAANDPYTQDIVIYTNRSNHRSPIHQARQAKPPFKASRLPALAPTSSVQAKLIDPNLKMLDFGRF